MLRSKRLHLRPVLEGDLTERYVEWLNDPVVNRFLETRFERQSLSSIYDYWLKHSNSDTNHFFAICELESGQHIGNIKLGPIDNFHRRAEVSLFIGEVSCWGQGLATEAISLLTAWAFDELQLQKLRASMYAVNLGSFRAFLAAGYELEGILKREVIDGLSRSDVFCVGKLRDRGFNHH